jgi:ATPase family protein associated with various cellular activities (AAA)/winged helix domain-containing protein
MIDAAPRAPGPTDVDALPALGDASAAPAAPFGAVDHLLAELRRLDLLLLHALPRLRRTPGDIPAVLRAISDDPATALAEHAVATRTSLRAAQLAGVRLPLIELCGNLGLDGVSLGVLILAIAPHVSRHYEDVFAWLQADAALRAPQLDLALSLFAGSTAERLALRERLAAGPLFASGFVWLADPPDGARHADPARIITASPRLLRLLCDHPGAEPEVEAVRARPPLPPTTAALERELAPLRALLQVPAAAGPIARLRSDDGPAALAAIDRLAGSLGLPSLLVDLSRPQALRTPIDTICKAVFDEARLRGAVLAIAGYDDLPLATRDAALAATAAQLERFTGVFVAIADAGHDLLHDLRHELRHRAVLDLTAAPPDAGERAELWRRELGDRADANDILDVARSFRLGASQIRDAARMVAALDATAGTSRDHLRAASRAQSRHSLGELAQHVAPWGAWDDLVIPPASVERLRDVIDHMHHRDTVFADWGLGRKVAVWRRATALFAGPPGTGKTLSASLVAQALGVDLFRIDLSGVVSKYIGETEKNLDRVFRAAHRSNAILFFDEADALFGKRTEVKDAHDRYANVETSYLLQKLETFEGLAILATNFKKNIDNAFLRRIDVIVDFPMPARDERRRLWRALLPAAMPLAGDVDLDFLAERFELAGGLIMNAIRTAALRSAAAGQSVGMAALLRGVRDELHKQGKLLSAHDLAGYAQLPGL